MKRKISKILFIILFLIVILSFNRTVFALEQGDEVDVKKNDEGGWDFVDSNGNQLDLECIDPGLKMGRKTW